VIDGLAHWNRFFNAKSNIAMEPFFHSFTLMERSRMKSNYKYTDEIIERQLYSCNIACV